MEELGELGMRGRIRAGSKLFRLGLSCVVLSLDLGLGLRVVRVIMTKPWILYGCLVLKGSLVM